MKKLSDYKDEAAFDLLADLLDPISQLFADKGLKEVWETHSPLAVAKYVLKEHKKEGIEIIKIIDDTVEITPISAVQSLLSIINDIENDPAIRDFFKFAEQESEKNVSSGSATANTEVNAE